MKYFILAPLLLISILAKSQNSYNNNATTPLNSFNSAGGDESSMGGTISYSIGQVFYSSHDNNEESSTEGVQQPVGAVFLEEPVEKEFKVLAYPNPTTNYFTVEVFETKNRVLSYSLADMHGKVVSRERMEHKTVTVPTSNLPAALYVLNIYDHGELIQTTKIIKK